MGRQPSPWTLTLHVMLPQEGEDKGLEEPADTSRFVGRALREVSLEQVVTSSGLEAEQGLAK